jgi:hypothetical protein
MSGKTLGLVMVEIQVLVLTEVRMVVIVGVLMLTSILRFDYYIHVHALRETVMPSC